MKVKNDPKMKAQAEEIELSPEEDAILDKIWDDIRNGKEVEEMSDSELDEMLHEYSENFKKK